MPAGALTVRGEGEAGRKHPVEALKHGLARAAGAQRGRLFLWCPPALAAGIGLYFSLAREPALALAIAAAALGLALVWFGRALPLLVLAGLVALGFALAKLKSDMVATPLLTATTGEVRVEGEVLSRDRAGRGRLVMILAPSAIEGLSPSELPRRLRLSVAERAGAPEAGAQILLRARLSPLPAPVMPGGFDYARVLWFEGIGGTGRVTSAITVRAPGKPVLARATAALEGLRAAMGWRIHAALEEPYASFAEALITGERSSIPAAINQSLLVSGLFHILSISGLHMWLVAGGVFWSVRAALALSPGLALRWPIKKWAAAAALLAGFFYMLLAQGGVATERSFLMIAVVFFAVMVDRPALSARNLALAALLILLRAPEAAVEASFQMSFLAVLGLVAFHEAWSRRGPAPEPGVARHWSLRLARWGATALALSLVTSLIAGASSSVPAAYHFGRLSPCGVLANGLAIPVVGLIVMPAALVAAVLMPLGLEQLPLAVMAEGLKLVVAISDAVAALPGADAVMARPPASSVVLMGGGVVALSLLSGWFRASGLAALLAGGVMLLQPVPAPDILIDRTGANAALRSPQGLLVPAFAGRARYAVEKWLQANGQEEGPSAAARHPGWACAANRCAAEVKGRRVLYLSRSEGAAVGCGGIDILIADYPLRGACPKVPLRIDRFDLWRAGAHAVTLTDGGFSVATARGGQGARPWVASPTPRRKVTPPSPQDDVPLD